MIIAIDESGNFNKNSNKYNLFVAAHIQSQDNSLEIKKKQFDNWEKTIPSNMRDNQGEIKGQLLGEIEFKNFIKNVVFQKPEIRFTYVSIVPNKNKVELINKYKEIEYRQLLLSHEIYANGNAKKKYINFLDQFAKWINKRNESEYLKLLCLKHCLYDSLYNSFIYCIALNLDYELLNIEFKIDKDFISNEDDYWKSYSLKSIQEMTTKKPLPMLVNWPSNHPIREKYVIQEKGFDLKIFFDHNLKFEDSKKHFEIRIADIGAIILNRHLNGKGLKVLYNRIKSKKAANNAFRNIEFKDFDLNVELQKIINSQL